MKMKHSSLILMMILTELETIHLVTTRSWTKAESKRTTNQRAKTAKIFEMIAKISVSGAGLV